MSFLSTSLVFPKFTWYFQTLLLILALSACTNSSVNNHSESNSITQRDSSYRTVNIQKNSWFSENLKTHRFRNGEEISFARTMEEWQDLNAKKLPAYTYFNFDSVNYAQVGKLYNWYAVSDSRELAPKGWRIPSELDWDNLEHYCDSIFGKKMDIDHLEDFHLGTIELLQGEEWQSTGSNQLGFNALPGGYIDDQGNSSSQTITTGWWSSNSTIERFTDPSNTPCENCAYCFIVNSLGRDYHNAASKGYGLYVRCVAEDH